ncbi:hypothetical protein BU23DRAFT_277363 [Bimuria novae-zelandiae CBS 107.79]|uniref:Uncharacterized protein n=1 Tax=Bimuria novae-zelandiae CBS 107.79 TaxID=1447943 RepID=A0A6A5VN21_9PLEO|nr:hypothetical protein BU23DRAFT_277363 [Bimuria novae-zelandiae CBS 107.79]
MCIRGHWYTSVGYSWGANPLSQSPICGPTPTSNRCYLQIQTPSSRNTRLAVSHSRSGGTSPEGLLKLDHAYMLKFQTNPGENHHAKLIVGTVRKNKQGLLDFEASASELVFQQRNVQRCDAYFGAECAHRPIVQYNCTNDQASFQLGKYTSKGAASPEFADPKHFLESGEMILNKDTKYNILFNNCRWHVRRVANVAKFKPGEDPTVPQRPSTPEPSSPTWSELESPGRRPLQVMNPDPDSDSD